MATTALETATFDAPRNSALPQRHPTLNGTTPLSRCAGATAGAPASARERRNSLAAAIPIMYKFGHTCNKSQLGAFFGRVEICYMYVQICTFSIWDPGVLDFIHF